MQKEMSQRNQSTRKTRGIIWEQVCSLDKFDDLEFWVQYFVGSRKTSEDENSVPNSERKDQTHEVVDGNKDSTGNQTRDHPCYILGKQFIFCTCLNVLQEAQLKIDRFIKLVKASFSFFLVVGIAYRILHGQSLYH